MRWKCKICNKVIEIEEEDDFGYFGEEELWGHIQMEHKDVFEEVQDLDTPDMLDECYE